MRTQYGIQILHPLNRKQFQFVRHTPSNASREYIPASLPSLYLELSDGKFHHASAQQAPRGNVYLPASEETMTREELEQHKRLNRERLQIYRLLKRRAEHLDNFTAKSCKELGFSPAQTSAHIGALVLEGMVGVTLRGKLTANISPSTYII